MELFQEMMITALSGAQITLNLSEETEKFLEDKCYQALKEIQAVVRDDSLTDPECFMRIEKIIDIFESLGSDGGARHDFG